MKACRNSITLSAITLAAALTTFAPGAMARFDDYSELRGLVDRTQSDLRQASGLEHGKKQLERYHDAQDTLSKLDRKLSKGKFDKGALEHSIGDIKGIIDHNTLQPSGRDELSRDLTDLKIARDRR